MPPWLYCHLLRHRSAIAAMSPSLPQSQLQGLQASTHLGAFLHQADELLERSALGHKHGLPHRQALLDDHVTEAPAASHSLRQDGDLASMVPKGAVHGRGKQQFKNQVEAPLMRVCQCFAASLEPAKRNQSSALFSSALHAHVDRTRNALALCLTPHLHMLMRAAIALLHRQTRVVSAGAWSGVTGPPLTTNWKCLSSASQTPRYQQVSVEGVSAV